MGVLPFTVIGSTKRAGGEVGGAGYAGLWLSHGRVIPLQ